MHDDMHLYHLAVFQLISYGIVDDILDIQATFFFGSCIMHIVKHYRDALNYNILTLYGTIKIRKSKKFFMVIFEFLDPKLVKKYNFFYNTPF